MNPIPHLSPASVLLRVKLDGEYPKNSDYVYYTSGKDLVAENTWFGNTWKADCDKWIKVQ